MSRVYGIGETILDILFDETGQPMKAVPGGSTFNALVTLSRLGVPTSLISEVGDDHVGGLILRFLDREGISTEYVDRFRDGKSPVSLAFLDANRDARYLFYKQYPARRLDVGLPPVRRGDLLAYGSYYALDPALRPRVAEQLEHARDRGAILSYDPNFRDAHAHEAIRLMPNVLDNMDMADIVRGSDEDFRNLFGTTDTDEIYEGHVRFHCPRLIVTRGERGADLRTPGLSIHLDPLPAARVASTIGAGDNFNAGILYGLAKAGIDRDALATLDEAAWRTIARHGAALAAEVCASYENYVPREFAERYAHLVK